MKLESLIQVRYQLNILLQAVKYEFFSLLRKVHQIFNKYKYFYLISKLKIQRITININKLVVYLYHLFINKIYINY